MTSTLQQKIRELLKRSEHNYYRLVLVGETNSGKTSVLRMVAKYFENSVTNVYLELSGAMLGLTAKKRSLKLQDMLHQIAVQARSLLVLDNLEIFFGKELKLEKFSHENMGQLNTYVTWYRKNMMTEGDNPPRGDSALYRQKPRSGRIRPGWYGQSAPCFKISAGTAKKRGDAAVY